VQVIVDQLWGAFYFRLLFGTEERDALYEDQLVDNLHRGIYPHRPAISRRQPARINGLLVTIPIQGGIWEQSAKPGTGWPRHARGATPGCVVPLRGAPEPVVRKRRTS